VPAGQVDTFGYQVAGLLRDASMRRRMSQVARELALTRSWPQSLAPLVDAWQGAARRRAPVSGGRTPAERPVAMERPA
jgi:hypothetical protein